MQPESHEPNMTDERYECDAFERRMHELLDDRRAPEDDEQLRDQAESSAEYRELLIGQQAMLDGLELGEVPELSPDFAARCVAEVVQSAKPATKSPAIDPPSSRWSLVAICAVVAALLLVAIVPLRTWLAGDGNAPSGNAPEVAVQPDAPIAPAPIDEIDIPPADEPSQLANNATDPNQLDEVRAKYKDLYEAFQGLRQRLPQTDGQEDLLALRPQWVDEFAGGLRPVANSMGDAINVLRQNITPGGKGNMEDKPQARRLAPNRHRHLA